LLIFPSDVRGEKSTKNRKVKNMIVFK